MLSNLPFAVQSAGLWSQHDALGPVKLTDAACPVLQDAAFQGWAGRPAQLRTAIVPWELKTGKPHESHEAQVGTIWRHACCSGACHLHLLLVLSMRHAATVNQPVKGRSAGCRCSCTCC